MHFNKGDKVDFYEIKTKDGVSVKTLKHGVVVQWWDEIGFGSADVKDKRIGFGSGNVVKHRWKDPNETMAFTVWNNNKVQHFHHKANALKVSSDVRHVKYDLSVLTDEERSHFFSD